MKSKDKKLKHQAMQNLDTASPKDFKRTIKALKKKVKQIEQEKAEIVKGKLIA
mgnify:CR=1 FL=1